MNFDEREEVFRRALKMYRLGLLRDAAKAFSLLIEDGSRDPRHISYCGLLIATGEGRVREGLRLCEQAIDDSSYDTEMYLNLAKLHIRTGRRTQATRVLLQGLQIDPRDPALIRQIARINPRATPMLPFLNRRHPLNKYLGLATCYLLLVFPGQ